MIIGLLIKAQKALNENKNGTLKEKITLLEAESIIRQENETKEWFTEEIKTLFVEEGYIDENVEMIYNNDTQTTKILISGTTTEIAMYDNYRRILTLDKGQTSEYYINLSDEQIGTEKMTSGTNFNNIVGEVGKTAEKIIFEDTIYGYDEAEESKKWDISLYNDETVVAYIDNENTMHIQANGIILANTSMQGMFYNYINTKNIEIEKIDTRNVTSMSDMFYCCSSLESIDLNKFDTRNVTTMVAMFRACKNLEEIINLNKFDTTSLTTINKMFMDCNQIEIIEINTWNTKNLTNIFWTFSNCYNLEQIDISNWNTSNVTTINGMFSRCDSLESIDLSKWDVSKVTDMTALFSQCYSLSDINISTWDTSNVTTMCSIFRECPIEIIDISNWNTSKVTDMTFLFFCCSKIKEIDFSNFDISLVENTTYFFSGNTSLELIYTNEENDSFFAEITSVERQIK